MARDNVPEELQYLRKRARRRLVGAVALVGFSLIVLWTVLDSQPPANLMAQHPVEIIASAPSSGVASDAVVMSSDSPVDTASAAAVAVQPALTPASSVATTVTKAPVASGPTHAASLLPGKLVRPDAQDDAPPKARPTPRPTPKPTPVKLVETKPAVTPKPAAHEKTTDPERILNGLDGSDSTATKPAAADAAPHHYVQLGAYSDAEKAHQAVARLKAAGMPAFAEKVTTDNGTLTRVRVGPVLASEAYNISKKLGALGYQGQVISK